MTLSRDRRMRNVIQPPVARQMPMTDRPGMVRPPVTADRGVAYRPSPTASAPVRSTPVPPNPDRPPMERRAPERGNPAYLPTMHPASPASAPKVASAPGTATTSTHTESTRPHVQADPHNAYDRRRGEHAPEGDAQPSREASKVKPKEAEREPRH